MAFSQHSPPSPQHSRVSSTSSNHSISYELIPRQEPFSNPLRDLPSPRASFPFRKVQPGFESSAASHSHNQSRQSLRKSRDEEHSQSKELIQAIGEINSSRNIRRSLQGDSDGGRKQAVECQRHCLRMRELEEEVSKLQRILETERSDFQMQKKANEIYTEGFRSIRELLTSENYQLDGESIEEVVDTITKVFKRLRNEKVSPDFGRGGDQRRIIEEQEEKIRSLRQELLRSSQNNINAIFNTEITEAHCLHLQIKKMNLQITTLKQNLIRATQSSPTHDHPREQKIVNIYHHKVPMQSSDEEDIGCDHRPKKNLPTKQKRERRSSSSSQKGEKSRLLKNTESRMGELLEGYKLLREEYRRLEVTLQQLNLGQTDYRQMFRLLKQEISTSLQQQVQEVKLTLQRPSSSDSQKRMAQDLESKLNHLINTLNAPEKVNVEKSLGQDSVTQSKNVEIYRKAIELEARNSHLQHQIRELQLEKGFLRVKLMHMPQEEDHSRRLGAAAIKNRKYQFEELLDSRSDLKEQEIVQQLGVQMNYCIQGSSINKLQSSQSYHQSSHRNPEAEQLSKKLDFYKEELQKRDLRITELQNTIFDHLQSRTLEQPQLTKDQLRDKYEHYIANLKILLREAKRENEIVRNELIKVNELNISRVNDHDHNSVTLSDRTTKNPIAQTRMIRRAHPNNYEAIQLKLHIEEEIQKVLLSLLELYQKALTLREQDRQEVGSTLEGCVRWLIANARSSNKALRDTLEKEHVKRILLELGLPHS